MRVLVLTCAAALAACQRPAEPAAAPAAAPPASTAVNADPKVTLYTCEDGRRIEAGYPDAQTAMVKVDGRPYPLKIAVSGSGARYVGYGLQWWTKGPDAMLASLKPGEEVASAKPVRCWSGEAPAVEPPEPGTPGGLPDDRTPVSEAPFTPESAQGAANVVQTFYAYLEAGKVDEAAKLMRNAAPPDVSRYSSYHAQVGAPGQIEGAAGSLFVETPVVIYGRLKTGQEVHQSGRVVLRRVNDVPGSTTEQRQWRIERIELK
ncbi:MliC family protein [Phenylobacterium sp. VNQ135]|uniref:MliC family protein n=1 Tax=Phenylobacterium sp. VNQ135 TaxID=3400922 RepID=UPI003C05A972